MRILLTTITFLLLIGSASAQCTSTNKFFISATAGSLAGTETLVTASGTQNTTNTSALTAQVTSTWFQEVAGVLSSASVAGDSTTANQKGWSNDAQTIANGCSIPAGTFTFSAQMNDSSGNQGTNLSTVSVHVYKVNGGVFSAQQCGFTFTVTMTTTLTTFSGTGSCSQIDFVTNDRLYIEIYYHVGTTNTSVSATATTTLAVLGVNDFISFPTPITTPVAGGSVIAGPSVQGKNSLVQ